MILVEKLIPGDAETTDSSTLTYTEEQFRAFNEYLYHEIEDALSQRTQQEFSWIQSMRDYEARPQHETVNIPIEDAPNIVVPLIAIAVESIYAISIDLIFGTSPVLTVKARDPKTQKALQALVNKLVSSADFNLRSATEHTVLDDVVPGTGFFYVPYVEAIKKTDVSRVKYFGPRVYSVPPEDILTRGGSMDNIEMLPWIAYRTYPTEHELKARAKALGLDLEGVVPAGAIDHVRQTREALARANQSGVRMQKTYETYDVYMTYDIDEDGELEDMLVFYDRTSRKIMGIRYNPYERRPFLKMCYQIRAHQFYGMGPPEMLRHLQQEITTIHNNKTLNLVLANNRMWLSKHGTFPTGNVRVWPNRNVEVGDTNDVKEMKLSDIYPSEPIAEASNMQLAERRVGSELPMPKPSQIMSSRTPATTTLSLLQQVNRRFTPAFDQMKNAVAGTVKHSLFRIQEQLLAGNTDVQTWIRLLIGDEMAAAAIAVLTDINFDNEVSTELTTSSATVNRDAERQEWLQLADRLSLYYEKILQLAAVATNPQTPPPVAAVAQQIAEKAAEVVDRVLRTYDSVRDPENLIIRMNEGVDGIAGGMSPQALQQLQMIMQLIPQLTGQNGAGEGAEGESEDETQEAEVIQ